MKVLRFALPFALGAVSAFAQITTARTVTAPVSVDQPRLSLDIVKTLEKQFDTRLTTMKEPVDTMGGTHGLYLPGYGVVLIVEFDLVVTPHPGGLLARVISKEERAQIHTRKLEQLRSVEQAMKEMMTSSAVGLDFLPQNERVVLAVRLWNQSWEDLTNIPSQIVMSADRKSAMAGLIKEETSK